MIQSIVDFTLPNSKCNLFLKKLNGKVLSKTYYKNSNAIWYMNGYIDENEKKDLVKPKNFENQYKKIFKITNKKIFEDNLNEIHYPNYLKNNLKYYSKESLKKKTILNM